MRLFFVLLMAVVGAVVGYFQGARKVTRVYPLPHHIPKYEGGISLRFAMVHDVIHERYPRHGRAYYEERNRRAARAIADEEATRRQGVSPSPAYFALKDDLGVGLERIGFHKEAVELLRDKLRQQQDAGLTGRDLYSSKANLGTVLILWQMAEGFADLPATKQRLNEGLTLVRESMIVNPEAHFGREVWQAVLLEFFLATLDHPTLLNRFDMVGNRLDLEVATRGLDSIGPEKQWGASGKTRQAVEFFEIKHLNDTYGPSAEWLRMEMRKVGSEEGWTGVVKSHQQPVPFDEPTLGIVGMWRYGGGANPHFALALGEIMLRVGQRYIAWCAYERAVKMSEHFNSDAEIVRRFVSHCRKTQARIEEELPPEERDRLRPRFESELAFGQKYQQDYQAYEAKRIKEGGDIDDPNFYSAFDAEQGSIASPVGPEDQFLVEYSDPILTSNGKIRAEIVSWRFVTLFAGVFAFGAACLLRLLEWGIRGRRRPAGESRVGWRLS